ncbi:hypothetical protein HWV62_10817 [Athelia sp. TMB]|nr:hypothetical protein HWV62_10817 [Athelia sp. TMB]
MMPPFPGSALILLMLPSAIDARAITADPTSHPGANVASTIISAATNATLPSGDCDNIHYCRTLVGLVQSCILTILACVWFAVHRNVPAPKVVRIRHANSLVRTGLFVWNKVLDQRQAAIVFVVTLLVPEWVLAWALRQWLRARKLVRELENARAAANKERKTIKPRVRDAEKDVVESVEGVMDDEALAGSSGFSTHSEHEPLVNRQLASQVTLESGRNEERCPKCASVHCSEDVYRSEYDQVAMAKRVAKANEAWEKMHAFFIIMGGYQFYGENGPVRPVSPDEVVELVQRGYLVAPSSDELANQSKGDALSKGAAILQTLWFVMQCIARRIEHLPVTNLEVMTLAYTVITVAMYIAWWDKPLNVSCAVRVPAEEVEGEKVEEYDSVWDRILAYVIGLQDDYVDLRECTRVPTFWAGDVDDDYDFITADVIALLVAMVFGAVHCIAWSYPFQSHLEQQLWRASAIAIVAVPAALAVSTIMAAYVGDLLGVGRNTVGAILYVPLALIYIAARIILILISFSSLRMLPAGVYQTVQWTTFVPHI